MVQAKHLTHSHPSLFLLEFLLFPSATLHKTGCWEIAFETKSIHLDLNKGGCIEGCKKRNNVGEGKGGIKM